MGHVVLVVALLVPGAALLLVGGLGWAARLPRNRWVGVLTPASLQSDPAFTAANQVAGPVVAAAGAVAVFGGLLLIGLDGAAAVVVGAIAVVGAVVLLLTGGALGNRAATLAPAESACAGCLCGAGGCARSSS